MGLILGRIVKPMLCSKTILNSGQDKAACQELPLRLADFGVLHRNEASGALTGLTRVRRFQQIKDEVKGVLEFISYVYKVFGFSFDLKLSTRPEEYIGNLESWEKAEGALREALNESGIQRMLSQRPSPRPQGLSSGRGFDSGWSTYVAGYLD